MALRRAEPHRPDMGLFITVMILCVFGLIMVFSASMSEKREPLYFVVRQSGMFLIGLVAMVVAMLIDYRRWRHVAWLAFGLALVLLIGVEFFGLTVQGAKRWLFTRWFQPSEFAKLAVVLLAAEWLPRKGDDVRSLGYGLFPFAIVIGLVVGLVKRQPDMGTSMVLLLTAGAIFVVAGAELVQTALAALVAGGVYLLTAYDYQLGRIGHFWEPCAQDNSNLAQVCHGIIALGSGGILGLGVGNSRFRWDIELHAPYADSILAIIGEEWGMVGILFLLVLYGIVIYRGFRIALDTPDSFGRLMAAGITLWIAIQAAINIGGNIALIPFTGVPLPFVSHGGSALISLMFAVGILLNISRYAQSGWVVRTPVHRTMQHARVA